MKHPIRRGIGALLCVGSVGAAVALLLLTDRPWLGAREILLMAGMAFSFGLMFLLHDRPLLSIGIAGTLLVIVLPVTAVLTAPDGTAVVGCGIMGTCIALGLFLGGSAVAWKLWRMRFLIRAVRASRRGDFDAAAEWIEEELERRGPSAQAYALLSVYRLRQGRHEESLDAIAAAEVTRPATAIPLGPIKGAILRRMGRIDEALPLLEDAVEDNPRNFSALCHLGIALVEVGRRDEAVEALERAEAIYAGQHDRIRAVDLRVFEELLDELRERLAGARQAND